MKLPKKLLHGIFLTVLAGAFTLAVVEFWPASIERAASSAIAENDFKRLAKVARAGESAREPLAQALSHAYGAYAEFLGLRSGALENPRAVFFQLQLIKGKISSARDRLRDGTWRPFAVWRLERQIRKLLGEVTAFEKEKLSFVPQQIQQEQREQQDRAQKQNWEAWGRAMGDGKVKGR